MGQSLPVTPALHTHGSLNMKPNGKHVATAWFCLGQGTAQGQGIALDTSLHPPTMPLDRHAEIPATLHIASCQPGGNLASMLE